jgi:hypothetical protein
MRGLAGLALAIILTVMLTSESGAKALEEGDTLAEWIGTTSAERELFADRFAVAARSFNGPNFPVSYFIDCINEFARVQSMHTHRISEIGGLCVAKAINTR